jgi:hypothetical protein
MFFKTPAGFAWFSAVITTVVAGVLLVVIYAVLAALGAALPTFAHFGFGLLPGLFVLFWFTFLIELRFAKRNLFVEPIPDEKQMSSILWLPSIIGIQLVSLFERRASDISKL